MKINRIVKLKLVDARLYFVSLIVGLLTGLVAVPYHYLLQLFFNMRKNFFQSSPPWYYHIVLFLALWGILCFVARMARRWPYIGGGGISQTRGVINGRIEYTHSFRQLLAKFAGGVLTLSTEIMDSPGFSSFETEELNLELKHRLPETFREFAPYLGECQFLDCTFSRQNVPSCL